MRTSALGRLTLGVNYASNINTFTKKRTGGKKHAIYKGVRSHERKIILIEPLILSL